MSCSGITLNNSCSNGSCFDIESEDKLSKLPFMCYSKSSCSSYIDSALTNSSGGSKINNVNNNISNISKLLENNNKYIAVNKYNSAPFYEDLFIFLKEQQPSSLDIPISPSLTSQIKPSTTYTENKLVIPAVILSMALLYIIRTV